MFRLPYEPKPSRGSTYSGGIAQAARTSSTPYTLHGDTPQLHA